jgi:hypothetical protein
MLTFSEIPGASVTEPITLADAKRQVRDFGGDGLPPPPAPSVALANAGAGNVQPGVYRYRVTYSVDGAETEGGDISESVSVTNSASNGKITVTLNSVPSGCICVIYRTTANGTNFFKVAETLLSVFTDNLNDTALGVSCPAVNNTQGAQLLPLISAARATAEKFTRRVFARRQFQLTGGCFKWQMPLPVGCVVSLDEVKYYDALNIERTSNLSDFDTKFSGESQPFIRFMPAVQIPTTYDRMEAVKMKFTGGILPGEFPPDVRHAILIILAEFYNNREGCLTSGASSAPEMPHGARTLLQMHIMRFGDACGGF